MEVARTSMWHAGAPQFLWPQAVRYAAHHLNLWPRWVFYDQVTHQFFASHDVTFDESDSYYKSRPHRGSEVFPPPLFLTLEPPLVDPVAPPPSRPAPSGVSHVTPQSSPPQRPVRVVFRGARGAVAEGEGTGAAGARRVSSGGAGGVRVETTPEEDMAVSTLRPRPNSPLGFPSVPQFPPRSPPRPVAAEPGIVPGGGIEVPGGVGAGDTSIATLAPRTVCFLTRVQRLDSSSNSNSSSSRQRRQSSNDLETCPTQHLHALFVFFLPSPPVPPVESLSSSQWTHRSPLSRAVSPEPRRSRYRADGLFHLILRSRIPPPPVLPQPPELSLTVFHDPLSDNLRSSCPVVSCVLSALVTLTTAPLSSVSALVTTVAGFASSHHLDYAAHLLGFLAAAVPHLCAMLLAPEGDRDALDISIPRNHAEAVSRPWASFWRAAEEAEIASYRSTGTYVDAVPPPGANVVCSMCQREGVDFFQTFAPTPKMTTLWVLLHIAAHRDYDLHSLDFSTAFLQGSLHEQIWMRRLPGFTGTYPLGIQWQLRRPVYGLREAPREWHDTLRTTLAALEFFPPFADPSLFVRRGSTPFFFLVYVDDLVFATLDRHALVSVKEELQRRHTCTDLGELQCYLGLQITRDKATCTITLTQLYMVEQILTRFRFPFS
ncbi:unnamed protein product [Closterium sp. NIES-54]